MMYPMSERPMMFRTDSHNNPTAFTVDIAKEAGLKLDVDYTVGDKFPGALPYYTARLIGDPIAITIRVIDKITFYTKIGTMRWTYIAMPTFVWNALSPTLKKQVIGFMYHREAGEALKGLFA